MDALRLIKTARHALAEARTVPDALLEAWQAGLLTEAVGARIAGREAGELAALGQLLCDAGSHTAGCLEQPPDAEAEWSAQVEGEWCGPDEWSAEWSGNGRVERMSELGELEPVLLALGSLLNEVAETLVVLACGAEAESVYWRCIDGVDAGAECKDLVAELLRTVRRESGAPPGEQEGSEGPEDVDEPQAGHLADGLVDGLADGLMDASAADSADHPTDGWVDDGRLPDELDLTDVLDGAHAAALPPLPPTSRVTGTPGTGAREPVVAAAGQLAGQPLPILVVPLGPPGAGDYRPGAVASDEPAAAGTPETEPSGAVASSAALAPADCRSALSPARSVLMEASNSCICSNRLVGAVGTAGAAGPCGAAGVSDQGSDMRGPLQLGSAV
ncbi:DUF6099 family protein [Kitasatospora sp. MBT63]|uniref:DUF6099 family protein n=1 Tax=Kitasatospora sp. MBT63 TaxID=1444768 RepID=UPI00053AAAF6|nr:DUF6099 family protein [Kitasatospora sp. MBT63]